jgi:HPt (histidine-containing phosphotransfer) domain-containing protein
MRGIQHRSARPSGPEAHQRKCDVPVDFAHLRRYTLGDKTLEAEVLELFLAQLGQSLALLKAADSASEWKFAVHTLKGSSRAVGAWRIAELAQKAESSPEAAKSGGVRSETVSGLEAAALEARNFLKSSRSGT